MADLVGERSLVLATGHKTQAMLEHYATRAKENHFKAVSVVPEKAFRQGKVKYYIRGESDSKQWFSGRSFIVILGKTLEQPSSGVMCTPEEETTENVGVSVRTESDLAGCKSSASVTICFGAVHLING
jgi:hypothetical protein